MQNKGKNVNYKLKYSRIIPFKGFGSCTVFNSIYRNIKYKDTPISNETLNHELTHIMQCRDFHLWYFGFIIFYIWYVLEWLLKLPSALFGYRPYYSISFEQAAYRNQSNNNYLKERKHFDWMKYIFKLKKK